MEDFDAFVRATEGRIRRALVPVCGPDAARSATVEAFTHAWRHWERVAAMSNPAGYCYTVARSRIPAPPKVDADLPATLVGTSDLTEVEPRLVESLAKLTERQRTAVYLVHGCGWTAAEVGELCDISESSVRNHARRGLDHLRSALEVSTDDVS